jgi:hypothetical protein
VAEGAPLLREYVGKTCIEGSNPSGSARYPANTGDTSCIATLSPHPAPRHGNALTSCGFSTGLAAKSSTAAYRMRLVNARGAAVHRSAQIARRGAAWRVCCALAVQSAESV